MPTYRRPAYHFARYNVPGETHRYAKKSRVRMRTRAGVRRAGGLFSASPKSPFQWKLRNPPSWGWSEARPYIEKAEVAIKEAKFQKAKARLLADALGRHGRGSNKAILMKKIARTNPGKGRGHKPGCRCNTCKGIDAALKMKGKKLVTRSKGKKGGPKKAASTTTKRSTSVKTKRRQRRQTKRVKRPSWLKVRVAGSPAAKKAAARAVAKAAKKERTALLKLRRDMALAVLQKSKKYKGKKLYRKGRKVYYYTERDAGGKSKKRVLKTRLKNPGGKRRRKGVRRGYGKVRRSHGKVRRPRRLRRRAGARRHNPFLPSFGGRFGAITRLFEVSLPRKVGVIEGTFGGLSGLAISTQAPGLLSKIWAPLGRGYYAVGSSLVSTLVASNLVAMKFPVLASLMKLGGYLGTGLMLFSAVSAKTRSKVIPLEESLLAAAVSASSAPAAPALSVAGQTMLSALTAGGMPIDTAMSVVKSTPGMADYYTPRARQLPMRDYVRPGTFGAVKHQDYFKKGEKF